MSTQCKLDRMMNMLSKYNNMHKNGMYYVLNCTNNQIIIGRSCMLSAIHTIIVTSWQ